MLKTCHICKKEKETSKQKILIELKHETPVPLSMTVQVCAGCTKTLQNAGIERVRNTKLVI